MPYENKDNGTKMILLIQENNGNTEDCIKKYAKNTLFMSWSI